MRKHFQKLKPRRRDLGLKIGKKICSLGSMLKELSRLGKTATTATKTTQTIVVAVYHNAVLQNDAGKHQIPYLASLFELR
jgi:hypothetical protein